MADDLSRDLERLREENRALNEQVMLLVQTEQRLYRSQNELDSQLVRIRALARFALESGGSEAPARILERAVALLTRSFALEWVGVVVLEAEPPAVRLLCADQASSAVGAVVEVEPDVQAWLASVDGPGLTLAAKDGADAPAMRFARTLLPEPLAAGVGPQAQLSYTPLRGVDGRHPGLIVTYASHRRPAFIHEGHFGEEHLPFLELLALHAEHAIGNSVLTESLRERSAQLAASLAELEAAQNALVQSQKMEAIGRLAGGVAHDFNNLLTVILGYASTLTLSLPKDSSHYDNARRVVDAARRASGITSQLLALGRRQVQSPEDLDLAEQAQRLIDLLRRLVGEEIEIELRLDRSLGRVRADRSQLEQILLNLVVNARDAMPQGGRMRIVTRRAQPVDAARCDAPLDPAGFGVLEVQDTGIGMDEQTRSRIFEPFFTTKSPGQGTGLGLAVVYGIVKQSGGQVLVGSEPGRGSAFTVLLPLSRDGAAAPAGTASTEPAADEPAGPATVLVVEDEAGIRSVVAAALRRVGIEVLVAADGEEALASLRSCDPLPDLLLTDVSMPRMSGFHLAREVRREYPAVRVAFMSGYFGERAGVAVPGPFLTKPFAPSDLVAFVREQLRDEPAAPGAGH